MGLFDKLGGARENTFMTQGAPLFPHCRGMMWWSLSVLLNTLLKTLLVT